MKAMIAVPVTTGTMPQIDPAQVPDFVMTDLAQTIYEEMLKAKMKAPASH